MRRIDCDREWRELVSGSPALGALPRQTTYGDAPGLIPFGEAYPSELIDEADFKERIQDAHTRQIFPMYHHRDVWSPPGTRWNQNGLNYCWAYGLVSAMMDTRAREGRIHVDLVPESLGHCVGWRNRGNYLDSALRGATERGIGSRAFCPGPHGIDPRKFHSGWEENALKYRLAETWDLDNSNKRAMVRHAISVLCTGTPIYIAYNWWGHALQCTGVRWNEAMPYHVEWLNHNSHDEDDLIIMTGNRGVFDEAYGIRATSTILAV